MRKIFAFVLGMGLAGLVAHCAWSSLLAEYAARYYTRRMPNVRHLDGEGLLRMGLATAYLREAARSDAPKIAFFGSSMTCGSPFVRSLTDAVQGEMPQCRVINAGVIGASLEMLRQNLLIAVENDLHFEAIVLEIPFVNELPYLPEQRPTDAKLLLDARSDRDHVRAYRGWSYFSFFSRLPWGLGHLAVLRDDATESPSESQYSVPVVPDGYFASRDRFARVKDYYAERVRDLVRLAQGASDHVCVFVMPVHLAGVNELGLDAEAIEEQIRFTEAVCAAIDGVQVLRLESSFLNARPNFYNLTHLNMQGNEVFGRWIAGRLQGPARDAEFLARQPRRSGAPPR